MGNRKPQILLLGNGVNQAFGGQSWDSLLQEIAGENSKIQVADITCPAPLKAVLVTKDRIDEAIKGKSERLFGEIKTEEQRKTLNDLLSLRFDHILTTNYSYELECAALEVDKIENKQLIKIMTHTEGIKRAESKYLLHTYSSIKNNKIWHIHGEARKPNSIILGHYYYGKLLFKISEHCNKRKDTYIKAQQQGKEYQINGWIDAFILGDVYIFGFDFAEFDLWWLLNRRKREKAKKGKLFYYTPEPTENSDRNKLLELMGAEIVSCGYEKDSKGWDQYKAFYTAAIKDIKKRVNKNREDKIHG